MGSRLVLRGDYDIWRRDELHAELDRLDLNDDITMDMSGVTLIDAGSVSLLIALRQRLRERSPDANITFVNAPHIVRRVLDLCAAAGLFRFADER